MNGYTGTSAGWDGSETIFASTPGRRRSDCTGTLHERGRDVVDLAQVNEIRIVNGLTLPWLRRVGSDPGDCTGTVLDYLVASEQILQSVKHATVGTDTKPTLV